MFEHFKTVFLYNSLIELTHQNIDLPKFELITLSDAKFIEKFGRSLVLGESLELAVKPEKMGLIPTLTVSQKGYDNQANGTKTLSLCGLWRATTGTTMPSSFCEWIMGYEIGHTKLNVLGIAWFRSKQEKRLKF